MGLVHVLSENERFDVQALCGLDCHTMDNPNLQWHRALVGARIVRQASVEEDIDQITCEDCRMEMTRQALESSTGG